MWNIHILTALEMRPTYNEAHSKMVSFPKPYQNVQHSKTGRELSLQRLTHFTMCATTTIHNRHRVSKITDVKCIFLQQCVIVSKLLEFLQATLFYSVLLPFKRVPLHNTDHLNFVVGFFDGLNQILIAIGQVLIMEGQKKKRRKKRDSIMFVL